MRLTRLQPLLINTTDGPSMGKDCLKYLERLRRVISKNMFNTRQEHAKGSSETSKRLDKIRKAGKVDANTNELISNAFSSRITCRKSTQ